MQMHFAIRNAFTVIKNIICNDKILIQSNIHCFLLSKSTLSISTEKLFYIKLISTKQSAQLLLEVKYSF